MKSLHPWLRTLLSLFLYVAVYYALFRDIRSIALLVLVIVLHESGHYLAMRAFGYTQVRMLFVPMLGAFVSGSPGEIRSRNKILVLFAGPLPGIVLGLIAALVYTRSGDPQMYRLALMFIILNGFNLLPITPMDGGQLLDAMFPSSSRWIQAAVILLGMALIFRYPVFGKGNAGIFLLILLAYRLLMTWRKRDNPVPEDSSVTAGLRWQERLVFLAVWVAAFIIPLQILVRILPGSRFP